MSISFFYQIFWCKNCRCKHEKYIQSVIEEVRIRDPGWISHLLADEEHHDQVFQLPTQQDLHLNKPPLERIAGHMLESISSSKTQSNRYSKSIIKTEEITKILIDNLTSAAMKALKKHPIKLPNLINIGGYPEEAEDKGIYLHILKTADRFYLYIGQAYKFKERLEFHNDTTKRAIHPSLHYNIWDEIKVINRFSSIFVKLAAFDHRPRNSHEQLILNLEEMFLPIVLQTLKASDVEEWLSENIPRVWAERDLNVALPLWQGFKMEGAFSYDEIKMSSEEFTKILHDNDELRREWAIDLRDSY
ncbi:uncharacterized protein TRUGW13939_10040 [Talaromyces rugulosus]|uniref:GIY-YIG domain-containing protein n=1 Tax=Talaromyces rugulosus TaxID=121627 RepID=A0A7H8R8X5_TALRU|nr:uncharacterized protein TRUGW13939_10040 [Talaromyces rugulosus]QKX62874.1 hypothetical protein TRUGW13939_10040 [Talaromyces rugulosus]